LEDYAPLDEGKEAHWEVVERILFLYAKLNPGKSNVCTEVGWLFLMWKAWLNGAAYFHGIKSASPKADDVLLKKRFNSQLIDDA
jgi:hypothetical protein